MDIIGKTLERLETAAQKHRSVAVSFSGGKDSLAVLDLCTRSFEHVFAFYLYFIPNLDVINERLEAARVRWNLPPVLQYPTPQLRDAVAHGTYRPPNYKKRDLPGWTHTDIYQAVRAETGATCIATGIKSADSNNRRRMLAWGTMATDMLYPVADWTQWDVKSYLKARGIPLPSSSNRTMTGVSLVASDLVWLAQESPEDFAKLEAYFPFARAAVYRNEWYNTTARRKWA